MKVKAMTNEVLSEMLNMYEDDILEDVLATLNLDDDDGRDWLKDDTFIDYVTDDLIAAGFKQHEIDEVLCREINTNTAYKISAYILSIMQTTSDFDSIYGLKNVIKTVLDEDAVSEFTEDDLQKILSSYHQLS